jgi:hypothetical protein
VMAPIPTPLSRDSHHVVMYLGSDMFLAC